MKLKPVVASVVMLGLMAPALAKSSVLSQQAVLKQNSVFSEACGKGWLNRITISGKGNVVGMIGNTTPAGMFQETNYSSDIFINDATLIADAKLSSWSKATLALTYFGNRIPYRYGTHVAPVGSNDDAKRTAEFELVKNRKISHALVADEFYVEIGNLNRYPFYLQFGKKNLPFGDYKDPHEAWQIMSPTQMLTQVNAVAVIAGMSANNGLYASLFGFRGETEPMNTEAGHVRNFGAKVGYYDNLDQFNAANTHVNFNVSYLHNMWDTQAFTPNATPKYLSWTSSPFPGTWAKANHPAVKGEIDKVGGISIHGDVAYKAFSMSANYVTALKDMISGDRAGGTATMSKYFNDKDNNKSKMWAADVNADYSFKTFARNSSFGAGVQFTGNSEWIADNAGGATDYARFYPKWRLLGEYKINVFKNTDVSVIVAHSKSYAFNETDNKSGAKFGKDPKNGDDKRSTLGMAKLSVKF